MIELAQRLVNHVCEFLLVILVAVWFGWLSAKVSPRVRAPNAAAHGWGTVGRLPRARCPAQNAKRVPRAVARCLIARVLVKAALEPDTWQATRSLVRSCRFWFSVTRRHFSLRGSKYAVRVSLVSKRRILWQDQRSVKSKLCTASRPVAFGWGDLVNLFLCK